MRYAFNSKLFKKHNKQERLFTVEVSQLSGQVQMQTGRKVMIPFHQVWNDSCDEGIDIISDKTGEVAEFVVDYISYNGDGDIVQWTMVPTKQTLRRIPTLRGYCLVVYND